MKRDLSQVLRRGFEATVANWPVLVLRFVEGMVAVFVIIAAVIAMVVPALVTAGLSRDEVLNSADPGAAVAEWVVGHWMIFVWGLVLAFVVFGILLAIHSFVDGGSAQVFVDAERLSARRLTNTRADFGVFSMERWVAGGRAAWWRIFWIYNLAWSVALLFVLVPLLVTLVGMLAIPNTTGRIVIGCSGLALALIVFIPVAIVTSIWNSKAIAVCVSRGIGARESLRAAWREFRLDTGRHVAVAGCMILLGMAVSGLLSGFTIPLTFGGRNLPTFALFFAPVRIAGIMAQSVCSGFIRAWFMACFVDLTEERTT